MTVHNDEAVALLFDASSGTDAMPARAFRDLKYEHRADGSRDARAVNVWCGITSDVVRDLNNADPEIADDAFETLIEHGYLIDSHGAEWELTRSDDGDVFAVCPRALPFDAHVDIMGAAPEPPDGWVDFDACGDCIHAIAYGEPREGESGEGTDAFERFETFSRTYADAHVQSAAESFSTGRCECCGAHPGARGVVWARTARVDTAPGRFFYSVADASYASEGVNIRDWPELEPPTLYPSVEAAICAAETAAQHAERNVCDERGTVQIGVFRHDARRVGEDGGVQRVGVVIGEPCGLDDREGTPLHWHELESDCRPFVTLELGRTYDETNDDSDPERYTNYYRHDACGTEWEDQWSCACDDECPDCGTPISPYRSVHNETGEDIWPIATREH